MHSEAIASGCIFCIAFVDFVAISKYLWYNVNGIPIKIKEKIMEYLVRVSGNVSSNQNKTYVVSSDTQENAQNLATQKFCDDFDVSEDTVLVIPQKRTTKAIVAFVFMLIPILLSMISWKDGHNTVSIAPDYISCLYSVCIYSAFILRFKGVQRTVISWIDILFCVLSILLLSSFIQTILVTAPIKFLGSVNTKILLLVAITLSWLGLKIVSLACIAAVIIFALFKIAALNTAMGMICGPLYIICSFVGILAYLSVEPAFIDSLSHFKSAAIKGLNYLSFDISQAKNRVENIKISDKKIQINKNSRSKDGEN